jgi:branched-subunit amino acid ABC-type transport system permease component
MLIMAIFATSLDLLVGYTGLPSLGHAAFIAVGAYTSTLLMLQLHLPYPITLLLGGITGGLWCVLFGLPSARVKGFYLIMTTMAAQFITVEFFITQYVSQIGGRGVAFSLPPGTVKIGTWVIQSDREVYYLMVNLSSPDEANAASLKISLMGFESSVSGSSTVKVGPFASLMDACGQREVKFCRISFKDRGFLKERNDLRLTGGKFVSRDEAKDTATSLGRNGLSAKIVPIGQ